MKIEIITGKLTNNSLNVSLLFLNILQYYLLNYMNVVCLAKEIVLKNYDENR